VLKDLLLLSGLREFSQPQVRFLQRLTPNVVEVIAVYHGMQAKKQREHTSKN
jgi:hypothetical protein